MANETKAIPENYRGTLASSKAELYLTPTYDEANIGQILELPCTIECGIVLEVARLRAEQRSRFCASIAAHVSRNAGDTGQVIEAYRKWKATDEVLNQQMNDLNSLSSLVKESIREYGTNYPQLLRSAIPRTMERLKATLSENTAQGIYYEKMISYYQEELHEIDKRWPPDATGRKVKETAHKKP